MDTEKLFEIEKNVIPLAFGAFGVIVFNAVVMNKIYTPKPILRVQNEWWDDFHWLTLKPTINRLKDIIYHKTKTNSEHKRMSAATITMFLNNFTRSQQDDAITIMSPYIGISPIIDDRAFWIECIREMMILKPYSEHVKLAFFTASINNQPSLDIISDACYIDILNHFKKLKPEVKKRLDEFEIVSSQHPKWETQCHAGLPILPDTK